MVLDKVVSFEVRLSHEEWWTETHYFHGDFKRAYFFYLEKCGLNEDVKVELAQVVKEIHEKHHILKTNNHTIN